MTTGQATDRGEVCDVAAIDRLLARAVADGVAPGFVGAVADRAGMLFESGHGLRAAGGVQPMTADTIFWLASMTKLVTTIAAMQLVEAGDIALDAPVAALLPELAEPRVLTGIGGDGRAVTRPTSGPITLRHLLTHTSGIGYELMNPALLQARGPAGPPPATSLASLEGPLANDPGAGWAYGYGVDWAGIIVERQSGLSLDRYLADHVFMPLGMHDTGFAPRSPDRLAAVHLRDDDSNVAVIPSPAGTPEDQEFHAGGAGLYGTARDYLRLLRMLLRGGELDGVRILREATVDTLWDNQVGSHVAGRLDTAWPALIRGYDAVPGQDCGWSLLGVRNPARVPGGRSAGSAGWVGVAGTFFWIDRSADLCGVLLAQLMPFGDPALVEVQRHFEHASYAGATARSKEAA